MSTYCHCKKYKLSYREVLSLSPGPIELQPICFKCPVCDEAFRITWGSRAEFFCWLTIFLVGAIYGSTYFDSKNSGIWLLVIPAFPLGLSYFVVWPMIVRLEPWAPFEIWLPKSRLVGYSVYLLLPASVILGLLFLAVKMEWGM